MADSTHILKLKATLDTSEVKSKLDQLRQVQQQALGNNQKSGNAPPQGVGGNLTQLTSTLNRLNTTMMQMQRTLSQLAINGKVQNSHNSSSIPVAVTQGGFGASFESAIAKTRENALRQIFNDNKSLSRRQFEKFARRGRASELFVQALGGTVNQAAAEATIFRRTPAGKDFISGVNRVENENRKQALKPILGLAIHQGASMIGNFARQNGDNTTAFYSSALGKIGGYAMMGSVAGPLGAGIGAALGAVETLFDKFTEKAKEAQKQLDDWNKNIDRSQTFKKTYDEAKETRSLNSQISKAVKSDDIARLNFIADQIQKKIDLNSKFLEGQRSSSEYGDTAENIMDIFNEQEKRISQLEHIKSLIDQINDKKEKEAEIEKKNIEIEKKKLEIENEIKKKKLEMENEIERTNLNNYRKQADILKQSFAWSEEDRQNRAKIILGPSYSDDIGPYDYDTLGVNYNTYRAKYGYFKYQYKTNLDKAENATTSESAKNFLDIASRMKDAMNFNKSQMDLFGGAQLEMLNNLLSNIKAPDMTNVTSLASQGLMTYGKDDQLVDLQVDYMKQQLDVQKQIKDKIREHVEFE